MPVLNLGILAHVDAGKTSLTERLLHTAGVIDQIGSVDAGSTRTDSLALERRRGITIRSAVVSFRLAGVTVNLVDTPGHPDFIAEVERVLGVLDGAVLVVSAVEGVQAQTRVLLRALHRLRIPTLILVNKIDRRGARYGGTLAGIARRLTPAVVPMGTTARLGTRDAAFLPYPAPPVDRVAELDDGVLADWVAGRAVPADRLRAVLAAGTAAGTVHPVFFGSAITGAGIDPLVRGIAELLPAAPADDAGPLSGTVFKVERGPAGGKVAYARLFAGTVRVRNRLPDGSRVTALTVADQGADVPVAAAGAGRVVRLHGLDAVRVGDPLGVPPAGATHRFAPPTLESVVVPARPADRGRLQLALTQLAEQDPLIDLRHDERRGETSVSLYGEVQKEVLRATLAEEYGLDVGFRETTTICVERVVGTGAAVERIGPGNPFWATVGLRVGPAPVGAGVTVGLEVELGSLPHAFFAAVEEAVRRTLREGLRGWAVPDAAVTVTHSGFSSVHSTGADFRALTPLVLMAALRAAGTVVCEPVQRFTLEVPADTLGAVTPLLARHRAVPLSSSVLGEVCVLTGRVSAARVHALQRALPGPTRGEGVLEAAFDHHEPVRGAPPTRPRTDANPLVRKDYLLRVTRRV